MLSIRLTRTGKKGQPNYRIVVTDERASVYSPYIENLGNYDPKKNPAEINLKEDRVRDWLSKGAKATVTVANLLKTKGIEAKIK